ncbi:MAG: acetylornithine/succinylornithine family transaminase, partial [Candidatus Bipolaricaulota bacterium]|nr:acetylornithine/succinylornithine family transaminase [Candidatus Bipolaricaulota bacterium]
MNEFEREDRFSAGVYSRQKLQLVEGSNALVRDQEGNEYLDFTTGIGVAAVGHANEQVAEAIKDQVDKLLTCSPAYFYNDVRTELLEKLADITPGSLSKSFLCNSGTEAIEASLKFARAHTGREEIIATMRGFHGRTLGSLSATWKRKYTQPFEPLIPGFNHVPYGDLDKLGENISQDTAAVLIEPIQGEGGIHTPPEDYLSGVRGICDEVGALLIFDEVQTGFGRTGKMFASQHWNATPDIMAVAKAMGGGVPIGASVVSENMDFSPGLHGSTFGGNPLSARAALATIDYIEENDLVDFAQKRGETFKQGLEEIASKHEKMIREVRGLGLMLALQLRKKSGPYLDKLLEKNILALPAGSSVIRFLPPLEISPEEIDRVLDALGEV